MRESAKPAEDEIIGRDRRPVSLVLGLAREWIGERRDHRADARAGRIRLAPVDRRKQHAALLPLADDDFQLHCP